jgi:hypothetical protein
MYATVLFDIDGILSVARSTLYHGNNLSDIIENSRITSEGFTILFQKTEFSAFSFASNVDSCVKVKSHHAAGKIYVNAF